MCIRVNKKMGKPPTPKGVGGTAVVSGCVHVCCAVLTLEDIRPPFCKADETCERLTQIRILGNPYFLFREKQLFSP